jgi:hypothetical protein
MPGLLHFVRNDGAWSMACLKNTTKKVFPGGIYPLIFVASKIKYNVIDLFGFSEKGVDGFVFMRDGPMLHAPEMKRAFLSYFKK